MASDFPLAQWFDILKPISRDDRELAEAQIALYAVKQGDPADGPEVRQVCAELRAAVKQYNATFRKVVGK